MELFIPANFFYHFIFHGTEESWAGGKSLYIFAFGFVVGLFVVWFSFGFFVVVLFGFFLVFLFVFNLDNSKRPQRDIGTFLKCQL